MFCSVSRPWKVAEVARLIGIAPRSLQRALTNANTTFRDVVTWERLGHAGALMADQQLSLADIAFCAGFADQAHMTRVARAHWMLAPAQFRSLLG